MFAVVLFIILKIGIKTNFPSLEERINKPLFSPTMGCYTEDKNGCTRTIWITICKFQEPELSDKEKVAKVYVQYIIYGFAFFALISNCWDLGSPSRD